MNNSLQQPLCSQDRVATDPSPVRLLCRKGRELRETELNPSGTRRGLSESGSLPSFLLPVTPRNIRASESEKIRMHVTLLNIDPSRDKNQNLGEKRICIVITEAKYLALINTHRKKFWNKTF